MLLVRGSIQKLSWCTAVAVAMYASLASAQAASAQAVSEVPSSPGVKIGDGRLHPFLDVTGRYDSAVGFFNTDAAGKPASSPEIVLGFRGGTRFELSNDSTNIGFNGAVEYLYYTGALSPVSKNLSRVQANVGIETAFNRDGAVEVQVGDNFVRSDRTQNPVIGVGVLSLFNEAHIAAPIHPGGRALEITPRVGWSVEFFNPLLTGTVAGCAAGDITCDPNSLSQMNYSSLNFGLQGRYKFLPKTAIMPNSMNRGRSLPTLYCRERVPR